MKQIVLFITILIILSGCAAYQDSSQQVIEVDYFENEYITIDGGDWMEEFEGEEGNVESEESVVEVDAEDDLPSTYSVQMQFVSQSPFASWDELHEEACEEASMILVKYYFDNKNIDAQIMEDEIQEQVKWQTENGYSVDLDAAEVKTVLKDYFEMDSFIIENPTVDQFKSQLIKGYIVILPTAGRMLGNPYFSGEGPLYHMLPLIGYDRDEFITNDVGTRRGKNYKYDYQVIIDAIHEWNGGDVYNGAKKVIVVTGN